MSSQFRSRVLMEIPPNLRKKSKNFFVSGRVFRVMFAGTYSWLQAAGRRGHFFASLKICAKVIVLTV